MISLILLATCASFIFIRSMWQPALLKLVFKAMFERLGHRLLSFSPPWSREEQLAFFRHWSASWQQLQVSWNVRLYVNILEGFIRECRVVLRCLHLYILPLFSSLWEQLWFSRPPLTRVRDQMLQIITKACAKAGMVFSYFPFMESLRWTCSEFGIFHSLQLHFSFQILYWQNWKYGISFPQCWSFLHICSFSYRYLYLHFRKQLEFVINACHL